MASLKPIGRDLFLRKCTTGQLEFGPDGGIPHGMVGLVAIPDWKARNSDWFEILDVGPDCKLFKKEHIGGFVTIPEWHRQIKHIIPKRLMMVSEKLFEPSKIGGVKVPAFAPAFVVIS